MRTSEELRESGLERTAFLIDRVTWRGGMACPDHEAWWKKKRESWATLGLDVVKELLARIAELEEMQARRCWTCRSHVFLLHGGNAYSTMKTHACPMFGREFEADGFCHRWAARAEEATP
jgi:hypothetical protein